jgi:superfamily II DNA/RNA helicase
VLVAGGMSYSPQLRAFERGVDIVVATPGRLIDLMERGTADLSRVEIAVLDEADHMADLGFLPAMVEILDAVPPGGQRLLFSATLDDAVDRLVQTYLSDPVRHEVDPATAGVTSMVHHVLEVAPRDKARLTAEIAGRDGRTVVFVRTQRGADRVAEQLRDHGVLAGSLHGGLPQGTRTRVLGAFRAGSLPVLVATDVAARGIHVDDIGLVLHADPPGGPKEYLHRSGRTARAGGTGTVVTLVLPHQRREVRRLTAAAGVRATPLGRGAPDRELVAATGARSASGEPISAAQYQRLITPAPSRRRARVRRG